MTNNTQTKMAAILAAAQEKANQQTKTAFPFRQPTNFEALKPEAAKQPEPMPTEQTQKVYKMLSFTILWHEGTNEYENTTFTTWNTAKKAFCKIYDDYKESGGFGYDKVKCCIKWENGHEITDRIDVGNGSDFNPYLKTFKEFLQPQTGVMYESNLQVGDRAKLSFEDEYLNLHELQAASVEEFLQSPNFINDAAEDETQELSDLTIEDILQDNPQEPEQPKNAFQIVYYSDKAFAIITAVKPPEDVLNIFRLHGTYNRNLRCGKGWIFSKRHLPAIKEKLGIK